MRKTVVIVCALCAALGMGCRGDARPDRPADVIASVDSEYLTLEAMMSDMPAGLSSLDSLTFARLYVDNWIMKQLKMRQASEVLSSSEEDIERLVEGYRQSLVMRKLDQYYIDSRIDPDVTKAQIAAYYRSHGDTFKLDHNLVKGVIVKVPQGYRNMSKLVDAVRACHNSPERVTELAALCEKNSLQLVDMTSSWVGFSDFLSNLPTVRSRSYDDLLTRGGVQQMTASGQVFCFMIDAVAAEGSTAPLERVESDIRRILYAQRRAAIVSDYEEQLRSDALRDGRIGIFDPASGRVEVVPARAEVDTAAEVEVEAAAETVPEPMAEQEIEADNLENSEN